MGKIFINEGINIYLKAKFPLVVFYIILMNAAVVLFTFTNYIGLNTILVDIFAVIFALILVMFLELKFEAKAVRKLNEKYNFTSQKINKKIVIKAIINSLVISLIMILIMSVPLIGIIISAIYTLCDPVFTEQYYIKVFKTNKISFSFDSILIAIKQHLKFLIIMFVATIVIAFAGVGIMGAAFWFFNFNSMPLLLIDLNITMICALLISIYQNAIIMSYFVKNPTVNLEKKVLDNPEY